MRRRERKVERTHRDGKKLMKRQVGRRDRCKICSNREDRWMRRTQRQEGKMCRQDADTWRKTDEGDTWSERRDR